MSKITWAPLIPLVGGFPIGSEAALGTAPEEIFSYANHFGNDKHYVNYQQNTLGRSSLKYTVLDADDITFDRKINIIVGTPTCAALSQLNTGTKPEAKGAGCAKNDFMMMVFRHGMKKFDADVIIVENAPALSTPKGQPVADALYEICKENGYSMTLYKTSTHFHGIPQRRDRTFAIAWKSKTAPLMEFHRSEADKFADYLKKIPADAQHNESTDVINFKLLEDGYWKFISATIGDPRKLLPESGHITCFNYVNKNGLLDKAIMWLRENGTERNIKLAEHAKMKFDAGKGIWDGSVHIFADVMNAYIGRNANDTLHPIEDRSLTVREGMHMMGLPHDMELLGGKKNHNHICQNVPTCTAAFIVGEAAKFLRGELTLSSCAYIKQDNWTRKTENLIAEEPVNLASFVS